MNAQTSDPYREWLSPYLDGALNANDKASLEKHLPGCRECRDDLSLLRSAVHAVSSLPKLKAPPGFADRVSAQVRAEAAAHQGGLLGKLQRLLFQPLFPRVPVTAALAVLVVAVAYNMTSFSPKKAHVPVGTTNGAPAIDLLTKQDKAAEQTAADGNAVSAINVPKAGKKSEEWPAFAAKGSEAASAGSLAEKELVRAGDETTARSQMHEDKRRALADEPAREESGRESKSPPQTMARRAVLGHADASKMVSESQSAPITAARVEAKPALAVPAAAEAVANAEVPVFSGAVSGGSVTRDVTTASVSDLESRTVTLKVPDSRFDSAAQQLENLSPPPRRGALKKYAQNKDARVSQQATYHFEVDQDDAARIENEIANVRSNAELPAKGNMAGERLQAAAPAGNSAGGQSGYAYRNVSGVAGVPEYAENNENVNVKAGPRQAQAQAPADKNAKAKQARKRVAYTVTLEADQ